MGVAPVEFASYLKLTSLPGSDVSLKNISSFFNHGNISVASAASKNNFLSNFTSYRIVQIYSHASFAGLSGKPEIYFADSSLVLSELFSRERPLARLVVLSACETALGKDYRGEGVFSFSREFAALGIPASVSNLWSVNNEATYRITELFYANISRGMPTDEALQQAKLKYIKESSGEKKLPFYWAASILTGKTEIITTNTGYPILEIVIILGIAGIFIWAGFKGGFLNRVKRRSS
jgi:CHAT domain-containing protein